MPKAKQSATYKLEVLVSIPRAGEFIVTVPIDIADAARRCHDGDDVKELIFDIANSTISERLKVKPMDLAPLLKRIKADAKELDK